MERPPLLSLPVHASPEEFEAMSDALQVAQNRARESERIVGEYDARFSAAVKRIRDYVEEGWEQLLIAQHRVAAVEGELAEAQRLGSVEEARVSAMLSTLSQLRQQASILEMEFQRRKRLQAQLDLFQAPAPQVTPTLIAPQPHSSTTAFIEPRAASSGISPSSLAAAMPPTSPWPTPAITPRPSPSPSPAPVLEPPHSTEMDEMNEMLLELKRRVYAAEERARQAEEERTTLELRLRSLVAALDEDSRSVGAMRSLLQKATDPSETIVLPTVDARLQTLRNEANSALHVFVRWLLSFFVPTVLED